MGGFTFQTTPSLLAEPGGSAGIGALLRGLGCRSVLVVTDKGVEAAGLLGPALRGLDEGTAQRALECLRGALRGRGGLLITHSPEEARLLADEVVVLEGSPVKIKICKTAR